MDSSIFLTLALSLGLTLAMELAFALLFGVRGQSLGLVALVNLLTNPVVVYLYFLLSHTLFLPRLAIQLPLEVLAVLVEALCYRRCAGQSFRHPFAFSLGANLFSYTLGAVLPYLI